ncbi:type IV secretion protein Dot [Legionella bononiensis]|uniref:Type IV secretion protein Dot n=1 Tax=Legionella bononiensis TaxID=2793102 RepID=A0ABS1W8N7_9GAMM|nr:type IV secretion protein Dot [Legionella bononiensis]MBL7479787.1 type IV secretion protein Dot [Legionella bononiensis]MBL7525699.1 type IV secretion protein Dot [Legionella bononiensis]MBL7561882.1 type IV secretion protein Dot [Legionella bononiensis]
MRYILPPGAFTSINFLRDDYQKERKVDLDKSPSMFGTPIILGGTDVVARDAQTKFIKKMLVVFSANLLKDEQIQAMMQNVELWAGQLEAHFIASRIMLATCLYVQTQIKSPKTHSALFNLINRDLGINAENYFEEDDKLICFMAANTFINSSLMALTQANTALKKVGMEPFSDEDWNKFSKFLSETCKKSGADNPYKNYPVTSITQPMFGAAFAYTGATLGCMGGQMVSDSVQVIPLKFQLTALIGSSLLMIGSAGPMGVALFSQVIACKLITTFCSISMAHILGTAMGIVGQGVGMGVGLPLDAAYNLLWKACAIISGYYSDIPNTTTGIRIKDGANMICGMEVKFLPESDPTLTQHQDTQSVEMKEGSLLINGKPLEITDPDSKIPPEVLEQLKLKLCPQVDDALINSKSIEQSTPAMST